MRNEETESCSMTDNSGPIHRPWMILLESAPTSSVAISRNLFLVLRDVTGRHLQVVVIAHRLVAARPRSYLRDSLDGRHVVLIIVADEAYVRRDDFRARAAVATDDGRAGHQGLDHPQTERLVHLRREEEAARPGQQLSLLPSLHVANIAS